MTYTSDQGIKHPLYGTGTIKSVNQDKITVLFDDGQTRTIKESFLQSSDHELAVKVKAKKKNSSGITSVAAAKEFLQYLETSGCFIQDNNVYFPEPLHGMEDFLPKDARRIPGHPSGVQICGSGFVAGLLKAGFAVGKNGPLPTGFEDLI